MNKDGVRRDGTDMVEPEDVPETPDTIPREAFTRTPEQILFAVIGYLVISIVTKTFLTWTMAVLYFVLTLDVLPRLVGRARAALFPRDTPGDLPRDGGPE